MNLQNKLARELVLLIFFLIAFNLNSKGNKDAGDTVFPNVFQSLDDRTQKLIKALPAEEADWFFQDFGSNLPQVFNSENNSNFLSVIQSIAQQIPELSSEQKRNLQLAKTGTFEQGFQSYIAFCRDRRILRLEELIQNSPEIVFIENEEFGNAPRLNMSMVDGPYKGKPFTPGAAIFKVQLNADAKGSVYSLLTNTEGMIRDLDVSFDGKRLLFSQKESIKDDWQIYELNVAKVSTRQVTKEKGVANIQPCYLPNGILFHSTRCVTVVDCNQSIDAVNIYRSDLNGENIMRLTVDQVSTQFPALLPDGRIIYTRWEYNDRGQIFPQALFTMYPDGSHQSAFYGNNSWYPTSLIQAKGIPGSKKVMTIIAGHHTGPMGKLALINVAEGQEEGEGIRLLAPERSIEYKRKDKAEQEGQLFQYPYPLSENEFLVGYSLFGKEQSKHFGIYWMNKAGERELLAGNPEHIYRKPMLLASRPAPRKFPSQLNTSKKTGTFYVSNVYVGPGMEGVSTGAIKSLRVIALDYRSSGIRTNYNKGASGQARVNTPVSVGGSWDTKTILGDAKVHADGSCYFEVPAHTPVYFQAIDQDGAAVQSMRSWSTLMPGESFSCIGCHDSKSTAPVNAFGQSMALKAGPSPLKSFYGIEKGFSYTKEIQPILDKHCIKCHQGESIRSTIHAEDNKAPSFGVFSKYLANAEVITGTYQLPQKTQVRYAEFNWEAKAPENWKLSYLKDGNWKELNYSFVENNYSTQFISFPDINTNQIRLEVMPESEDIKLINLCFFDQKEKAISWGTPDKPFSLTGAAVDEPLSGRRWSESYLRLVGAYFRSQENHVTFDAKPNPLINWISPQSEPTMLKPYETGSSKSGLIKIIEGGHKKVKLSGEEMDKLRCWIDLAIPYCGTYDEANIWSDEEKAWFKRQNEKRKRLASHNQNQ